jgi:hypothetical protein
MVRSGNGPCMSSGHLEILCVGDHLVMHLSREMTRALYTAQVQLATDYTCHTYMVTRLLRVWQVLIVAVELRFELATSSSST